MSPAPAAPTVPSQPLTPSGWLMQNGLFLVLLLLAVLFAYQKFGGEWILNVVKAGLGIGFIIFIHELGHFLAAKWCDVHVVTFSIGFGPAVPGCSYTWGETTYKLAILPIGGFVNMVGEGPEADEEEEYPRSFKNKTVFQRMLIISAGVIMNVAFGMACFIGIYLTTGVSRMPAVVYKTDPGSPAWQAGVRAGWTLTEVDGKANPWWNQMHVKIALSSEGKIPFTFTDRDGKTHFRELEPYRDDNYDVPFIGVEPLRRLELVPLRARRVFSNPFGAVSPAAHARAVELGKGDVVVGASSVEDVTKLTPLPPGAAGWAELAKRFASYPDAAIELEVRRAGKAAAEKVAVPPAGFDFGDAILGTTNPATPDEPFDVTALRLSQGRGEKRPVPDAFDFRARLEALAGKPIVVQVRRARPPDAEGGDGATVTLFVPPAYHVGFGARMNMGKIAALRAGSPASHAGREAGPTVGDVIKVVEVQYGDQPRVTILSDKKALDPLRLPYELERTIRKPGLDLAKWKVHLTVRGTVGHNADKERTLNPMAWDDSFSLADEPTRSPAAPMSIPQLGIAYWVESTVVKVDPGSAADLAGLVPGDEIREINFRLLNAKEPDEVAWAGWDKMASRRGRAGDLYDQWAYFFNVLQQNDYPQFRLRVKRGTELVELPPPADEVVGIVATPDASWPSAERGLGRRYTLDSRRQKAKSILEAVQFGVEDTGEFIRNIYMNLSRLVTRRISTRSLGGPIEIATQAFSAAGEDVSTNLLFLAMISINLAVVNFLPIPLLDGGHMVFLIYEKIRRRPPSEMVRVVATYIGLAFILGLMGFVLYLDISRRWF